MTEIDTRELRHCLGRYATGIAVVTASDSQGNPFGITVNSFASVSLDPPLILWSLGKDSGSFEIFSVVQHYAVHVLHSGQQPLSDLFSANREDRFSGISYQCGTDDTPLLDDYYARFECQIEHRYEGGDHLILVGRVLAFDGRDGEPLIYHGGSYKPLP